MPEFIQAKVRKDLFFMAKKKKKKKYRLFWFFVKVQIFLMICVAAGIGFYYGGGYAEKSESFTGRR